MSAHDWIYGGMLLTGVDEYGVRWTVEKSTGWAGGTGVRRDRQAKAQQDGNWPSKGHRAAREVVLTGKAWAPDHAALDAAGRRFAAVPLEGELVGSSEGVTLTARVGLLDAPAFDHLQATVGSWTLAVSADDPLLYGPETFGSTSLAGGVPGAGRLWLPSRLLRTNLCINPHPRTAAGYQSGSGGVVPAPWDPARSAYRATSTGVSTQYIFSASGGAGKAGDVVTVSGMVQTPAGTWYRPTVHVRTGNKYYTLNAPTLLSDGKPVRVSHTATLTEDAVDLDLAVLFYPSSGGGTFPAGVETFMGDVLIEKADEALPYFDGDTPDTAGMRYDWVGTPGASASTATDPGGRQWPRDWGVPPGTTPGAITLPNAGKAAYWPRLRITGPVPNPVVSMVETGDWIRYNDTLEAGQWLDIDCGNRRVLLNGQVSVRQRVTSGGRWLAVPEGGGSITWTADAANPEASLSVWGYESAWL